MKDINNLDWEFIREIKLSDINILAQSSSDMFKSVIDTGKTALQNAILINGGAAVAILALIGAISASGKPVGFLVVGATLFAIGALSGALGAGATCITQMLYGRAFEYERKQVVEIIVTENMVPITIHKGRKFGNYCTILAIVSVIVSYSCFLFGVIRSTQAFQ